MPRDDLAHRYSSNNDSEQPGLPQPVTRKRLPVLFQAFPQSNHTTRRPVIHLADSRTCQDASDPKRLHQQQGNHDVDDRAADGNVPFLA